MIFKLGIFFAGLIALGTALCPLTGNDRGIFCAMSGNFQVVWWREQNNTVSFTVSVDTSTTTWAAIGFSNDSMMPNTDVAIAANDGNGNSFVEDRWNFDRSGPVYDPEQNFMDISSSRVGNRLTFSFTRLINSPDESGRDLDLEDCVYVLWAFGGTAGFNPTTIGPHSSRGVFEEQLCVCDGNLTASTTLRLTCGTATAVLSLAIILLGVLVATIF